MAMAGEGRPLGGTGITVSSFCFGTWELGGLYWGPISAEDAVDLLRRAFDQGVTLYDASDNYGGGRSEVLLSVAFHGRRHDVTYVTKAGYLGGLDGAQALRMRPEIGGRDQDHSPEYIRWACELSLRRLNTDYIDVYLLHDPPPSVLRDAAPFEALRELQQAGKIRTYGVSSSAEGAALAVREHGAQVVMAPFNLLDQRAVDVLLPLAAERGAGVLARSPFAGGLLLDEVVGEAARGTVSFSPLDGRSRLSPQRLEEVARRASQLQFLTEAAGGRLSVAAIRYVLSHPQVGSVVTGVMRPEELDANLQACRPPYFEDALLQRAYALWQAQATPGR
ncbi:MAG TPA: aldo/keto reductase [Chloroflexota bacterium]|nr:aldo/keto reductase [Chloroflexota bacterium]